MNNPEDYGQGDENTATEIEANISADTVDQSTAETTDNSTNPAWNSILDNIPTEFHQFITPELSKWDSNFQTVQQKSAPYKEFIDLGVSPEEINRAMQLNHMFNTSPREVYDHLQKQFNYGAPEGQGQREEEQAEEFDLSKEGQYDLEKDPRFIQAQQQAQFASQAVQKMEQDRVNAQVNAEVDRDVQQVQTDYPHLDIQKVANYALGVAQNTGKNPNLIEAAAALQSLIPQARVSDSAPPVLSGNRGLPVNKVNYGAMSSDERSKMVADAMRAAENG